MWLQPHIFVCQGFSIFQPVCILLWNSKSKFLCINYKCAFCFMIKHYYILYITIFLHPTKPMVQIIIWQTWTVPAGAWWRVWRHVLVPGAERLPRPQSCRQRVCHSVDRRQHAEDRHRLHRCVISFLDNVSGEDYYLGSYQAPPENCLQTSQRVQEVGYRSQWNNICLTNVNLKMVEHRTHVKIAPQKTWFQRPGKLIFFLLVAAREETGAIIWAT